MLIADLKAFVAVIDHNSLTRAAHALSLTQSAISRRIQHLEEALGASLFDRNSKPPKATALARRVYEDAVPLLRNVGHLLDIARESAAPSGMFRLGFTQLVADIVLFDAVLRMKSEFPALEVQLQTDRSPTLQQHVERGELDAATLMLPAPSALPAGLSGRYMTTLDVVIVQSRHKPLVSAPQQIKALAGIEWILNPHGCSYRNALEHAMADAGQGLRLSVDTFGTEMQLRLVAAGLGLGLVPRSVLRQSSMNAGLSVVEVADFALQLDIWLVYPPQLGNLRRAATMLGDTVAASFVQYDRTGQAA